MNWNERFTRLWTEAQPRVAEYLFACAPDFHAAEDMLQNVAVALLRKFPEYDETRPFVGWAIGIAKIEILRHRRKQATSLLEFRPELADELAHDLVEMMPELDRRTDALRRCTQGLQGRSGEILRLRYGDDLKPREIASRLGLNSLIVRVTLNRVRDVLRKCIERRLKEARA